MRDQFIPYELALELKNLGFDEKCFCWYDLHELVYYKINNSELRKLNKHSIKCSAPLYQQAFKWFREKYDIDSSINKQQYINKYCVSLDLNGFYADDDLFPEEFTLFNTYEYAELECLKKLIEIVKNK